MPDRVRTAKNERRGDEGSTRVIQRKLEVGPADDPLEHEADRTADLVMQQLGSIDSTADDERAPARQIVRRAQDPETIGPEGGDVDTPTERAISSSIGQPLPANTRSSMESAFGADLSKVRVHTGPKVDDLNTRLSARAFTSGNDVFVRSGDYAPGTTAGQRIIAHELAHVVQQGAAQEPAGRISRLIMTDKQWMALSTKTGKPRSALLLKIDDALTAYNIAKEASPAERADLLQELILAITTWKETKPADDQGIVSARKDAIDELMNRVEAEFELLVQIPSAMETTGGSEPLTWVESSTQVAPAIEDIYKRAIRSAQGLIAKESGKITEKATEAIWDAYVWETHDLMAVTQSLDQTNPKNANAYSHAAALHDALFGLTGITYSYHNIELPSKKHKLAQVKARLDAKSNGLNDDASAEGVEEFIDSAISDLNRMKAVASGGGDSDPITWVDDDRKDLIDEVIAVAEQATGIGGYFGTGGKGNEGFSEFYQADPETKAQENIKEAFSKDAPKSAEKQDQLSGGMDMGGGLASLSGDYLAIIAASKTMKDKNSSPAERREAQLVLVGTPTSILSNFMKVAGGAFTAARSGGKGTTYKSTMKWTAGGTDASTDFKMVGDFAGLFTDIINSVKKTLDVFTHFKEQTDKEGSGEMRKKLESFGLIFKKTSGTLTSLANNARSLVKLGYQITGGGQVAASAVSPVANEFMTKAVPGMNLVMGVLDAVQQIYKLVRIGIRRTLLTKKIEQLVTSNADFATVETVEYAHDSLVKRSARIGINLAHALTSVVSGALTTSGIGWAPGMVLGVADTATKIGQIGLRKAKQKLRDVSAKKHAIGDESYQQWKLRKKQQAAAIESTGKRRWAQFRSAIDIKFTFNWDKSTENKAATVKAVAMEALRMNDDVVFEALGVSKALSLENKPAARVDIVVDALRKRD